MEPIDDVFDYSRPAFSAYQPRRQQQFGDLSGYQVYQPQHAAAAVAVVQPPQPMQHVQPAPVVPVEYQQPLQAPVYVPGPSAPSPPAEEAAKVATENPRAWNHDWDKTIDNLFDGIEGEEGQDDNGSTTSSSSSSSDSGSSKYHQ